MNNLLKVQRIRNIKKSNMSPASGASISSFKPWLQAVDVEAMATR
jgi:hypothetical protein